MFGADDDVPKKLGSGWDRLVDVGGWPVNGGLLVSIGAPSKNDVLPPSGPDTVGFITS